MARRLPERGSHLSLQHLPPTPEMVEKVDLVNEPDRAEKLHFKYQVHIRIAGSTNETESRSGLQLDLVIARVL